MTEPLRQGARGDRVRRLQRQLLEFGYELPRWGADGVLGAETTAAVCRMAADRGLTFDLPGALLAATCHFALPSRLLRCAPLTMNLLRLQKFSDRLFDLRCRHVRHVWQLLLQTLAMRCGQHRHVATDPIACLLYLGTQQHIEPRLHVAKVLAKLLDVHRIDARGTARFELVYFRGCIDILNPEPILKCFLGPLPTGAGQNFLLAHLFETFFTRSIFAQGGRRHTEC